MPPLTGQQLAVKIVRIPPDNAIFVKRLTREVQILREIHHQNIVHLHKVPPPPRCLVLPVCLHVGVYVLVGLVGVLSACMLASLCSMYVAVSFQVLESAWTCNMFMERCDGGELFTLLEGMEFSDDGPSALLPPPRASCACRSISYADA